MKRNFNFGESPVKKLAQEIRDERPTLTPSDNAINKEEKEETTLEEKVEQPVTVNESTTGNQQEQEEAKPAENITPAVQVAPVAASAPIQAEATKGISVKIPISIYDELDVIKKRTQRTGNKNDKMGIGDLVIQAVKEFVDRNKAQ